MLLIQFHQELFLVDNTIPVGARVFCGVKVYDTYSTTIGYSYSGETWVPKNSVSGVSGGSLQ
jgi:hypothetical protein